MMYVDILSTDPAILFLKIESTYGTSVAIVVNAFLASFRVSLISVYPNLTRSSLVEILPIFDFVRSIQKVRCLRPIHKRIAVTEVLADRPFVGKFDQSRHWKWNIQLMTSVN